jgi:UPF0755 protein
MTVYRAHSKRHFLPRRIWLLLGILIVLFIAGSLVVHAVYDEDLRPVNNSQTTQIFTVEQGSSIKQIADNLESNHLIRSAWAFELYVQSRALNEDLQAGTYAFSPSQGTTQIISTLIKGKIATKLVTILPGIRIDQVRSDLINDGFSPSSVDSALTPGNYQSLPVMAFKPASVTTLEGLLWPDSFDKNDNTTPSTIIRESLLEMGQQLTPTVQAAFAKEGLTTYQGLILASMVGQEVPSPGDQAQVAQVFLTRLKSNIALGSDVTAFYGAIEAGQPPSLTYNSPYNTLLHTGLPPTPISSISSSSLQSAAHPAATNWLYFVSGDNGVTYFSTTLQQQEANTQKYCQKLCSGGE